MEFSTQTTASLHQIKTAALAVGVFSDGMLSPAADVIDHASNGALRAIIKTEFTGKPNTHLVLRNLAGISATRIILVGLGKQDSYNAAAHAGAELVFANYCANAGLTEGVSELVAVDCPKVKLRARTKAAAVAAGRATYRYDTTPSEKREPAIKLKKIRSEEHTSELQSL